MPLSPHSTDDQSDEIWGVFGRILIIFFVALTIGSVNFTVGRLILKAAESHADNQAMFQSNTLGWAGGCLFGLIGVLGYGVVQFIVFGLPAFLVVLKTKMSHTKFIAYSVLIVSILSTIIYYSAPLVSG